MSRMNPEMEAVGPQVHPIPSGRPTSLRKVHSATPPPDRAMPAFYVVWDRGRRMALDRDEELRRAVAYGTAQTDREAAKRLGIHHRTFSGWRRRRGFPPKLLGRPRSRMCPTCGTYLGRKRNYCIRCGWGNPKGNRPW